MRRLAPSLLALLLGLPLVGPASAGERWLSTPDSNELQMRIAGAQLEVGVGRDAATVALPPGAHVEELVATRQGWITAGTVPASNGRELILIAHTTGEIVELPPPPGRDDDIRDNPVLLTENGELVGMLWLQGLERGSFRIEYAEWRDGRWRNRGRLVGRGPGSQLALDATVLEDGSWLAVWSRFDRRDDEIYWSRRSAGEWSEPARVSADNGVPDIVPSVVSVGREALLSWSRFDGEEYRLMLARFDGEHWVEERFVGPRGSLFPSWHPGNGGPTLVYRQAEPQAWVWMELDASGRAHRYSVAPGTSDERPLPTWQDDEPQLLFPSGRREAVTWLPLP